MNEGGWRSRAAETFQTWVEDATDLRVTARLRWVARGF